MKRLSALMTGYFKGIGVLFELAVNSIIFLLGLASSVEPVSVAACSENRSLTGNTFYFKNLSNESLQFLKNSKIFFSFKNAPLLQILNNVVVIPITEKHIYLSTCYVKKFKDSNWGSKLHIAYMSNDHQQGVGYVTWQFLRLNSHNRTISASKKNSQIEKKMSVDAFNTAAMRNKLIDLQMIQNLLNAMPSGTIICNRTQTLTKEPIDEVNFYEEQSTSESIIYKPFIQNSIDDEGDYFSENWLYGQRAFWEQMILATLIFISGFYFAAAVLSTEPTPIFQEKIEQESSEQIVN